MGIVFLGILLLVAAFMMSRLHLGYSSKVNIKQWALAARIVASLFIVGGLLASTIVIIPAGYRGVKLQFGAVKGVMTEGIHMISKKEIAEITG